MHNNGVEEGKTPVDSSTQHHYIDKKRYNDVLKKCGMSLNEFAGPEGVQEST